MSDDSHAQVADYEQDDVGHHLVDISGLSSGIGSFGGYHRCDIIASDMTEEDAENEASEGSGLDDDALTEAPGDGYDEYNQDEYVEFCHCGLDCKGTNFCGATQGFAFAMGKGGEAGGTRTDRSETPPAGKPAAQEQKRGKQFGGQKAGISGDARRKRKN